MTIESALLTRSESSCELCRSTDDLRIFAVPPFESAEPDYCLLICRICDDHLEGSSSMDVNYWRCLNDTMWSQVRPVQIMTWRLLTKLNSEPWAQDLLDILYLEDDTLALAKTGTFDGDAPTVKHKDSNGADGKDIKLKADIEAEEFIKRHISSKSNLPMLGEETGKSVEDLGKSFWVIDPLDGTANYSRGIPICCVSIALIHDMQPVIGVIYDFNNEDLYEGSLNSSACLNGEAIEVNNNTDEKESILLTGLPLLTDYSDSALVAMTKDFQKWKKIRMIGSAAMASAFVASGKADMYKESGAFLWDVAAGAAIINAANGEALITNQKDNYQVDVAFTNKNLNK